MPSREAGARPSASQPAQSDRAAAPSHWVAAAPVPHQVWCRSFTDPMLTGGGSLPSTTGTAPAPARRPPRGTTPVPWPAMSRSRFRYSRWDGTQLGFDLDADAVLEQMTDDLLYHGDLNAALRRLLQSGFRDRQGEMVEGVRDLLERLRRERQERLPPFRPGRGDHEIAPAP